MGLFIPQLTPGKHHSTHSSFFQTAHPKGEWLSTKFWVTILGDKSLPPYNILSNQLNVTTRARGAVQPLGTAAQGLIPQGWGFAASDWLVGMAGPWGDWCDRGGVNVVLTVDFISSMNTASSPVAWAPYHSFRSVSFWKAARPSRCAEKQQLKYPAPLAHSHATLHHKRLQLFPEAWQTQRVFSGKTKKGCQIKNSGW